MLKSKKLRVMQITHDLALGGLQQVVVNLCRAIDREKFDVSVLCLRDFGQFVPEIEKLGIRVYCLEQKESGTDYFSFLKVAKILKREKIDIIHTHNTQPFVDGTIASLMSSIKTVVHTDHARDFPDKKRYMFAEWLMSKFVYKVVGVSEHTTQNLIEYEKISKGKVLTILNGVDESTYNIAIDKEKKRKELGINRDGLIIGLGVRLSEQKGVAYLIDAMPEVIKVYPDITLVVAGSGEIENELKRKVYDLGLTTNILFPGARTDIHELLKLFDLYILPSLWEGLPMTILEAMAAGCPIIATNVGGNGMAIENGFNGSLIEKENSKLLAYEILKLLKDKKLREMYVQNSIEIFRNKFSARIMARNYEKLYLRECDIDS